MSTPFESPVRLVNLAGSFTLGDGVEVVQGARRAANLDGGFDNDCYVPNADWRPPHDRWSNVVTSPQPDVFSHSVTVVDINPGTLNAFRDVSSALLSADLDRRERRAYLAQLRLALLSDIFERCGVDSVEEDSLDIYVNPPGLVSTAYNFRDAVFMGLHLDDHQNLAVDQKQFGFHLLSINLGEAEHYFYFVDLPAIALLRHVTMIAPDKVATIRTARDLKDAFFSVAAAEARIVRLRLQPGQGYIAVTQNIIHDGATNTVGCTDVVAMTGRRFIWKR